MKRHLAAILAADVAGYSRIMADDEAVEACVCDMDYVCCLEPWDALCVEAAADCGAC